MGEGGDHGAWHQFVVRVDLVFPWGATSMEETTSHHNNLPLLFVHLGAAPSGDVEGKVAQSSHRSLEPVIFVSDGRRSAVLRATNVSAVVVVFVVLQLGMWMMAGDTFLFFDRVG
jgi:hypothetical protein